MYAFLRKPAWVALHIGVLAIVSAFLLLGRWQVSRLDDRQAQNALIEQRLSDEPTEWLSASTTPPPEYTRLNITGEFRPDEEILLRSQVNLGRPGFDVLTPFYFDDDSAIIVNRGWVPLEMDSPPVYEAAPPAGETNISGYTRYPLENAADPLVPNTGIVARVDLLGLDATTAGELEMFYLELTHLLAGESALPIVDGPPEITEGPHLSYAVQWFAFAAVSLVGYAALIRSTARRRTGLSRREAPRPPLPS